MPFSLSRTTRVVVFATIVSTILWATTVSAVSPITIVIHKSSSMIPMFVSVSFHLLLSFLQNIQLLFFSRTECDCDPRGSQDEGLCDPYTDIDNNYESGLCHCKNNVEGRRCDHCKAGFWNLNDINPNGCEGKLSLILILDNSAFLSL